MSSELRASVRPDQRVGIIIVSGIVALAVAMGIGRFAFTPLMPLMIRDGSLDAAAGAEWAAANYAGYLAGALTAAWFSGNPRRGVLVSLLGVALTTVAAAWIHGDWGWLAGILLRAGAGVFSAWTLICASSWCLAELARRGVSDRGAWIYTGVGLGIALAGVLAWLGGRQPADWLWLELGLIAVAGAIFVWLSLRGQSASSATADVNRRAASASRGKSGYLPLVLCYGAFGFGYIVPATFLPTMARQLVSDPLVFGLTWPLFGLAAALSVAGAARFLPKWPRRRVWALAQAVMALGTLLPVLVHTLWALAASAIFVGGTVMVTTMAGLQLARELVPDNPTPLLARMTSAFAAGQIAGPLFVRALGSGPFAGWDAISSASVVATLLLVVTAAWLWRAKGV
jgi:MFS family permease